MAELDKGAPARRRLGTGLRAALLGSAALLGVAGGLTALDAGSALGQAAAPAPAGVQVPVTPEDGYADLAAAVMPAVVNVQVERSASAEAGRGGPGGGGGGGSPFDDPEMRRFFERFFGPMPEGMRPGQGGPGSRPEPRRMQGEGSGFIVSPDGLIVTNFHVAGEADKVTITMSDGKEYTATLQGADQKTDLAVLKINADRPLPYVRFGDSSKVRPGDKVIAVGNPFGLGGTVTAGIVSAVGRQIGSGPYDDFLQIDAPINRGNSGGPTFNLKGEVIGVNTAIFSPSGGSVGIGFAIASNQAARIVDDLRDDGRVERGWLGVAIQGVDEDIAKALRLDGEPRGALVSRVEDGSPAQKAGIRRGDVVLEFDGKPIGKVGELSRVVAEVKAGSPAKVVVWRDGRRQTLEARIGEMPMVQEANARPEQQQQREDEGTSQPRLGLSLAPLTPETRERLGVDDAVEGGVVVTEVAPDSPADAKGLRQGDVIVSVNQEPVREPRQVADALRKAGSDGNDTVLLLILRDGQQIFEAVPLAAS
jgi:serine protease Do